VHQAAATSKRIWTGTDALLLFTATIWGANYSIVKVVLRHMSPRTFIALRLTMATLVFLAAIAISRRFRARGPRGNDPVRETIADITPGGDSTLAIFRTSTTLSRRDWMLLVVLGIIGHFLYQAFFIEGLARTSVANASLLIGCTPMAVSLANAALGLERLNRMHWIGTALSLAGIYLVVGRANGAGGASLTGDVIMTIAVCCWVCYTLLGKELLRRHSPLIVTGYSMAIGAVFYIIFSARDVWNTDWARVTTGDWIGMAYATLLSFNVAYILWYAGVQRLGSARTSLYSNLVPIVSLIVAALWLGEAIGWTKAVGAAAVLTGLALTRVRLPQSGSNA
jgi:drug/metabolite transporter (DMT)-like permease